MARSATELKHCQKAFRQWLIDHEKYETEAAHGNLSSLDTMLNNFYNNICKNCNYQFCNSYDDFRSLYGNYCIFLNQIASKSVDKGVKKGIYANYMDYLLVQTEPKVSLTVKSYAQMHLLKKLVETLNRNKLSLYNLLKMLSGMDDSDWLLNDSDFIKESHKRDPGLTDRGRRYLSAKKEILHRWENPGTQVQILNSVRNKLREMYPDYRDLRMCIARFARELDGKYTKVTGYTGSYSQQLLLQMRSLDMIPDEYLDVYQLTKDRTAHHLYFYIAKLITNLLVDQLLQDGTSFSVKLPHIPREDLPVLYILSIVQKVPTALNVVPRMSYVGNSMFGYQNFADYLEKYLPLIENGWLWIDTPERLPHLKIVPNAYRLVIDSETPLPDSLWCEKNRKYRDLLLKVLEQLDEIQQKLFSSNKTSCHKLLRRDEFRLHKELNLILRSIAKKGEEMPTIESIVESVNQLVPFGNNRSTIQRIITKLNSFDAFSRGEHQKGDDPILNLLLRTLTRCCFIQAMSNDPAEISSGWDSLFQLWKQFSEQLKREDYSFLHIKLQKNNSESLNADPTKRTIWSSEKINTIIPSDFLVMKASRLLDVIQKGLTDKSDDKKKTNQASAWYSYLVAAESAAIEARQGELKKEHIRGACLRIRALVLQKQIGELTDEDTVIMNYALPALGELVFCMKTFYMDAEREEVYVQEIRDAAKLYNQAFGKLALDGLEELTFTTEIDAFDEKKVDEYCADIQKRIEAYEGELKITKDTPLGNTSPASIWPTAVLSRSTGRRFYQHWYLANLDSVTVATAENNGDDAQRYIMRHLLQGQNIVLTGNQLLDASYIRRLAHDPSFLFALKTGRITVSLFGNYSSLSELAAAWMDKTYNENTNPFRWSSLSDNLNRSEFWRKAIAKALRYPNEERQIFDEEAERFIEAVRILDDAIPHFHRRKVFQRGDLSFANALDNRYSDIKAPVNHKDLDDFHKIVIKLLAAKEEETVSRTNYLDVIAGLVSDDYVKHSRFQNKYDPHGELQTWYENLASKVPDVAATVIRDARFIANDVYGTMLSDRFSEMKEFVYTPWQEALMPYDSRKTISRGGCNQYGVTDGAALGSAMDFADVTEICIEMEKILRYNPMAGPSEVIRKLRLNSTDPLSYTEIDDPDGGILRLEFATTKTDRGAVKQTITDGKDSDTVYTETGKETPDGA